MEAENKRQIDHSKGEYIEDSRILEKEEEAPLLTRERFLERCAYAYDNCGGRPTGAMLCIATEDSDACMMEGVFSGRNLIAVGEFVKEQQQEHVQNVIKKRGIKGLFESMLPGD